MSDETAKRVITFVMKNNGKKKILESDFYLTISMRLQWCSPYLAKQFIQRAMQDDLLVKENVFLSAGFSLKNVSIPVGFKPTHDFFQKYKPKQSSLDTVMKPDLLEYVISNASFSDKEIQSNIDNIMKKKQVSENIALLLFAKKQDVSIEGYIESVEEDLFTENTE